MTGDNRLILSTQDVGDLAFMMSKANIMYIESLERGKDFDADEWSKIKMERDLIQDHITHARVLLQDLYNRTFHLRHGDK